MSGFIRTPPDRARFDEHGNEPRQLKRLCAQRGHGLGPLRVKTRQTLAAGPVKLAVRPQAWHLSAATGAQGGPLAQDASSLPATVRKCAYLGGLQELTLDTALGTIFVVSHDVERQWQAGESVQLRLDKSGLAVLA